MRAKYIKVKQNNKQSPKTKKQKTKTKTKQNKTKNISKNTYMKKRNYTNVQKH